MTMVCTRLRALLEDQGVPHETVHHRFDYTAQEAAADTHTRGREFAKVVMLQVDGAPAMIVLPAHHRVDFARLHDELGAKQVRMCNEDEMRQLFPDCEVGAEPPFGNLYGVPVYLSDAMKDDLFITFNAGTHEDVIRMRLEDYVRLAKPRIFACSRRV